MLRMLAYRFALAVMVLVPVGGAQAGPILEFSPGPVGSFGVNASVGWSFTTNQAITVIALDVYDPSLVGTQVRLYNSTGTTLASANLTYADAQEGSPVLFYTTPITPITLAANQTYYIAQDIYAVAPAVLNGEATGLTTEPSITYGSSVAGLGVGNNPTIDGTHGVYVPAYFGPNFDPAPVPEPSTLTLLGIGIAGLAGYGWRRRQRAVA